MLSTRFVLTLGLSLAAIAPLGAQRGRPTGEPTRSGPSAASRPSVPSLPNSKVVTSGTNPAEELVDKRRRLGLDEATLTTLRALAATMNERYAPDLARYDSLRTQVNMARNVAQERASAGRLPDADAEQIAGERAVVLGRVMAAVREQRALDVEEALAVVPEEKREAARAMLVTQAEELARAFQRSGREGAAAAGRPIRGGTGRRP